MPAPQLSLLILLVWAGDANAFHYSRHRIMTPNNGQTGSTPLSQGNINEIAMFPPLYNNSLTPDNNDRGTTVSNLAQTPVTSAVPIPASDITLPDISVETSTTATTFETVASTGGTVIRVEFPSSIQIYVNITNGGQAVIPTVGIMKVEIPTAESTVDTSTVNVNTVEASTVGGTVEISTVESTSEVSSVDRFNDLTTVDSTSQMSTSIVTETPVSTDSIIIMPTEDISVELSTVETVDQDSSTVGDTFDVSSADRSNDLTTIDSTSQMSTSIVTEMLVSTDSIIIMPTEDISVELSTIDEDFSTVGDTVEDIPLDMLTTTVEISTADSTVETSTADSTAQIPTTDSTVEMSTLESTVGTLSTESAAETSTTELSTVEILTESNSLAMSTPYQSSTETMRYIQININLSDNNQNGNFGITTRPTVENLGQLQNKMLFKQKCDEYYSSSRVGREAKVTVFIVGGTSSMPKEFPHMAALGYGNEPKKEWLCGGSLISENYVITAAHCVSSKTLGAVQVVRLGTTLLNTETLNSQDYKVIRRITHPGYTTNEQYNDIALLQLDRPVAFSEYISPICLYSSNLAGEVLIATGWGKTEATGEVSPELQKVELEYFPNAECQKSYSAVSKQDLPRGIVAETQICAGSRTEEKDTCQGDSGGPLQIEENERMYLVGITSFGIACGQPGRPGVYTRVSYYIPWIERIVWGSAK